MIENGVVKQMNLYICAPETEWNVPEGKVWSEKEKCHVAEIEVDEN
jgi:hypothetical protein